MKKKLLIASSIATLIILGLVLQTNSKSISEIDALREKHISFLDNSPFKETQNLSRKERKAKGMPPNSYFERQYELTLNPATGRPHPENVFELQKELRSQFSRVPGENANSWVERGPNDIGGRTKAMMYDPNDSNGTRVFAGGVSGGLWVNDDITDSNSAWALVNMPENVGISVITYDPNDTQTFYVGTGETFFGGGGNYGNGVWKSTDGGVNWAKIFGGDDGVVTWTADAMVTINSPGSIAGDIPAVLATAFGGQLGTPVTGDLVLVEDSTGDDVNDACEALTNGGAINGNIALIRRGSCNFDDKIKKAQDAGAIAVIMINNIAGNPAGMGGDDVTITIPSVMISRDEGNTIIAELGSGVNATLDLSGAFPGGSNASGVSFINDIKVRDVGEGNSEVFVTAGASVFYDGSVNTWYSLVESGLYMSSDGGTNFTQISLPAAASGLPVQPNDLEISADGTVWMCTTRSEYNGEGGGLIFSSTDGITFTQVWSRVLAGNAIGGRTQIAVSGTDPNVVYVLMTQNSGNALYIGKTNNAFTGRITFVSQPVDVQASYADDFTGGQGTYDLMLEVDPTDDTVLYVGGINLFRATNSGATTSDWLQISEAYTSTSINDIHPDQHALTIDPSNPDKGVFGNDGGVQYASTLSSGTSGISPQNNNYNTLQFYKGAIGQEVANEKFLAGAQDNNSLLINNASDGINGSVVVTGGDGTFCFIDRDNEYMVTSSQNGNFSYRDYATGISSGYTIDGSSTGGQFVNPADLDSANNILYADGTNGTPTYQIFRYVLGTSSAVKSTLTNELLTRNPQAFKASTFTTTTLFVGTSDGKLLKLLNANATPTWSDISGPDFVGAISCIELGATENDIYVTFFNYGVPSVFYTNDGGTTWQNKENDLPDLPVRAIMPNPLNADEVILGTELGVWATKNFTDVSPNWYQSQDGMKNVQVSSFDLRTADNTVLATTHGRGMFTGTFDAAASGLSVDDFAQNNLIKIYPTVSNGEITIAPTSEVRAGALNIFDVNGREVHASNLDFATGATQHLSLKLSSGVYIVKFTANDVQSTQKIIIK